MKLRATVIPAAAPRTDLLSFQVDAPKLIRKLICNLIKLEHCFHSDRILEDPLSMERQLMNLGIYD